jgi:hypothetical protein
MMDVVGRPLILAEQELQARQISYTVTFARPARDVAALLDDCRYVIRQKTGADGSCQLVTAAKLGREKEPRVRR